MGYIVYHDLYGPDDCGVYCESRGDVVLPRTGSDEPVDSVVCTSRPDEPVKGITPCWTGDEEWDFYEGDVVLPRTGSDESVDSVCTSNSGPDDPCVVDGHIYESAVALHRTGSDQTYNNVVSIVGPGSPGNEIGSVEDASGM